jgi:Tol biopolymer transport system component
MRVVVVNADGADLREISVSPAGSTAPVTDLFPIWSPDGTQILFQRWTHAEAAEEDVIELYIANADGSGLRQLELGEAMPGLMASQVTWSPDGSQVVFMGGVADGPESLGLYAIKPDGMGLTRLSDAAVIGAFAWSPDGTRIAFTGTTDELGPTSDWGNIELDLFTMNADGTNVTRAYGLPGVAEVNPAWSPDGMRLLYTGMLVEAGFESDTARATLSVVGVDGSNPLTLVADIAGNPQASSAPMWRPVE